MESTRSFPYGSAAERQRRGVAETKCIMDEDIAESWEEAADSGVGNHITHTGGLKQSVSLLPWKIRCGKV